MRRPMSAATSTHAFARSIRHVAAAAGLALGLVVSSASAMAQSATQWQAQQAAAESRAAKIMARAQARKGLLAQYQVMCRAYAGDDSQAFTAIFGQYMSWYQSFLGDYASAEAMFSIPQRPQGDDRPSPLATAGYAAHPAAPAIARLAHDYRIVLFNEAHNVALTRSLTVEMLGRLRKEGFDYFAVETLDPKDRDLQTRGYPVRKSGFYTEEPVYAEMVRTALKLGYKVIAYEAGPDVPSGDPREAAQARNLDREVFQHDPHARLVVNAGYGHIVQSGAFLGGRSMAEYLHAFTGLPMLSVEQTMLYHHPAARNDHPYYTAVMDALHPEQPIVFLDASGTPWSLRPGYDVSVFFPPEKSLSGRPAWLDLGGLRRPYRVDDIHCRMHFPCLVEARYGDESENAIPADRMVLDRHPLMAPWSTVPVYNDNQAPPSGILYLRPGTYRLRFASEDDRVLFRTEIKIPATPAASSGNAESPPTKEP